MLTPILMLFIVTMPYLVLVAVGRRGSLPSPRAAAAWGAGFLFLFTASGHFIQTEQMTQMMPPWVPGREALVYATGVLEIAIAIALFNTRWRRAAGFAAVFVLVAFFPANIYAAFEHVPFGGHAWGPTYLLIRGPLQLFLIGWIWTFVLRKQPAPLSARTETMP